MDELGQILSQARENKGLTVADVQQATRINPRYIEALENGEYGELPSPVHVRGFLRNYARYLGLDPAPLLERFETYQSQQPLPPPTYSNGQGDLQMDPLPVREDQPFFDPVNVEVGVGARRDPESAIRLLIIAALLIALGLVANRFLPLVLNNEDGSEAITNGITTAVQDIVNRGEQVVGVEGLVSDRLNEAEALATPAAPGDTEAITSTSRTNTGPDILPTPTPTRPALPATLEEIRLKIEVTERAWLESTIDDEVVFSGIARPGDTFEWTAANEAKLLTGNAIGLFVTINDIPLGRLGDRGQNKEEIWRTTQ